jgi:aspartate racemase
VAEGYCLSGRLNAEVLRDSVNEIVRRHEALRTSFAAPNGVPLQVIATTRAIDVPIIDLGHFAPDQRRGQALLIAERDARTTFDLVNGPLLRVTLLRLADDEHLMVVVMHHLVSEGGWSMGIFLRELGILYADFLSVHSPRLTDLPIQYADYVAWQRDRLQGEALDRHTHYWSAQLAGAPAMLDLPTDRPRPAIQSYDGRRQRLHISKVILDGLRALSRAEGATLFITLLAAFQTLLFRFTGQEDIVVGAPAAGRSRPEMEGLIGLFVNTLALRVDLSGDPTFRELIGRVREVSFQAFAHQEMPFEKLVEAVRPERALNRNPLFQVMFALQNAIRHDLELPDIAVTSLELDTGCSQFDLTLHVWEREDGLYAALEYATALFEAWTIAGMLQCLHTLLEGVVRTPDERLSALPLLTGAARHHLLVAMNDTRADYPAVGIHQLVEAQAQRTPDAVAVMCGLTQLTYREFVKQANQVARHLTSLGVGAETLVGVLVERSAEMVVGLLAILKAGGAYLPLDPALPPDRIAMMLTDSGASIVITKPHLIDRITSYGGAVVDLDARQPIIAEQRTTDPSLVTSPDSLAYVIYTSGSTGRPKGVGITHGNVVNLLADMQRRLEVTSRDVLVAVTTLSFDIAGLELWLPLIAGARVSIARHEDVVDGVRLAAELQRVGATVMQATPVIWQLLLESRWAGHGRFTALCGGEALSLELAKRLLPKVGRLWNVYGPTETTIWSTAHLVTPAAGDLQGGGTVALGRPIANTSLYVLDARQRPVPFGVPGELHIGGAGVGRGYLNRPELTEQRFITMSFDRRTSERLYRTGDRVRLRPDGTLEFLGRLDDQVKLRGFRIELGEIEAALAAHPAVQEAAVAVHGVRDEDRRLIAYVVLQADANLPELDSLRAVLEQSLPSYMVPSAFVQLNVLPRTANGKVDRRALPATAVSRAGDVEAAAPQSQLECTLQEIWQDVLHVAPIGITDNFFEVGGHSLLAIRVFADIRKRTGRSLPLMTLFRAPTIRRLAAFISADAPTARWSPLVQMTSEGDGAPVFIVHGLTGVAMNLRALALRIGARRPAYALQARGVDGEQPPFDRVEDIAACYIDHILAIQPRGPYLIVGFCFGGLVAFEIARRFLEKGEEVAFLGLLDTAFHWRYLTSHGRFRYELAKLLTHFEMMSRLSARESVAYLSSRLAAHRAHRACAGGRPLEPVHAAPLPNDTPAGVRAVTAAADEAFFRYQPSAYPGRVTYFRPLIRDFMNILNFAPEWRRKAAAVETVYVAGDHMAMLDAPEVDALAAQMNECIERGELAPFSGPRHVVSHEHCSKITDWLRPIRKAPVGPDK